MGLIDNKWALVQVMAWDTLMQHSTQSSCIAKSLTSLYFHEMVKTY